MPGPNMEVFKFGMYLFFPIFVMVQVGNPDWYRQHVLPYKDRIYPREEDTYKPPTERNEMRMELERLKARQIARRLERERLLAENSRKVEDQERLV